MTILRVSQNNAFSRYARITSHCRIRDHKRARLKVDVGVRLALEARQRVGEEHAYLEAAVEARIVEEARLEAEEEEQAR